VVESFSDSFRELVATVRIFLAVGIESIAEAAWRLVGRAFRPDINGLFSERLEPLRCPREGARWPCCSAGIALFASRRLLSGLAGVLWLGVRGQPFASLPAPACGLPARRR
jgi:hypothetical protein